MLSSQGLWTYGWFGDTVSPSIPNIPTDIIVAAISTSVLLISWEFDSYARGFDLYRSLSISGTFEKVNSEIIESLNFYDGQQTSSLSADTNYYYKVKALGEIDISGTYDSGFSSIATGKTPSSSEFGRTYYYPETIRNITTAILDMFNDFSVKRYDKQPARNANIVKIVKVPITFGPAEKRHLDELRGNTPGYQAPPIPRMALILNGMEYDASRASGINEIRHFYDTNLLLSNIDEFFADANPTPYNYNFTLSIRTDSLSDFSQIIENILPYFNPTRYLRVKEFAFLNVERDLPVQLGSISPEFSQDLEVNDDKQINGDLSLTVKGWMYRPISYEKIIKIVNPKFFIY